MKQLDGFFIAVKRVNPVLARLAMHLWLKRRANAGIWFAISAPASIRTVRALWAAWLLVMALPASSPAHAQVISTFAGTGTAGNSGDGGGAIGAQFQNPTAIAIAPNGVMYVADTGNHTIRRIFPNGQITRFAGNGSSGFFGDNGPAVNAALNLPRGLALDSAGNLYIADVNNNRIRRVDPSGTITTVAGTGSSQPTCNAGADGVGATTSALCLPRSVAVDASGNLYIADSGNSRVRRVVLSTGVITTVVPAASANGTPTWVAVDSAGVVYYANVNQNRVHSYNGTLPVATVAGTGTGGFNGDGPVASTLLSQPASVYVSPSPLTGTFIADSGNSRIRQLDAGKITTIAGNGPANPGDGGPALNATLGFVVGMARDSSGSLYLVDNTNNRIRKIMFPPDRPIINSVTSVTGGIRVQYSVNPTQSLFSVTVICGSNGGSNGGSGPVSGGAFTVGGLIPGQLYTCSVSASNANGSSTSLPSAAVAAGIAPQVTLSGPATSVSGSPVTFTISVTGNAPLDGQARVVEGGPSVPGCDPLTLVPVTTTTATATCVATLAPGAHNLQAVYLGNANNSAAGMPPFGHVVLQPQAINFSLADRSSAAGNLTLSATGGGSGNPVVFTSLTQKVCTTTGTNGTSLRQSGLPGTCTVRATQAGDANYLAAQLDRSYNVTSSAPGAALTSAVAGTLGAGLDPDGLAGYVNRLNSPTAVAADNAGNVYIADFSNRRIRRVDADGVMTTVAGGGTGDDGSLATDAAISSPYGVAVDTNGAVYVAERNSNRVRRFTVGGTITTVAGNGSAGYSGDDGAATTASLNAPMGLAFDPAGDLHIADSGNQRIRKVTPGGIISNVAGNGSSGYVVGSTALTSMLATPRNIAFDAAGNLYIAESGGQRIHKVDTAGVLTVIAGTGFAGNSSGDGGPASAAELNTPFGIAADAAGNVYIAQFSVSTIRKITAGGLISTVAGTGSSGIGADGVAALSSSLDFPAAIALDPAGAILVADQESGRVRRISFPPPTLPAAPVIGTAVAGASRIIVKFSAAGDGFSSILDFTATCTSGGVDTSATAPLPPIAVSGLVNGQSYSCSVRARNALGSSAPSASANAVAPVDPVAPLITSAPPPDAQIDVPYQYAVTATAAPAPTFTVSAGNLAPGLLLDPDTGVISGMTYGGHNTYFGTIRVSNGVPPDAFQNTAITVFLTPQAIMFGPAPLLTLGGSATLTAMGGGSGNAVTFSSTTPLVCTVAADIVTAIAAGNCIIAANQDGDDTHEPAPAVTQTIAIPQMAQVIVFGAAPSIAAGASGTVTATGGASGNAVTFATTTPAVCATGGIDGATVTGIIVGTCIIAAIQSGDDNYLPATQVALTITIQPATQVIVFGPPPSLAVGAAATVTATGGASGNAIMFTTTTPATCSIAGATVTGVAAGGCVIAANQAGNAAFAAAPQVTLAFAISATVPGAPQGVTAMASAGSASVAFSAPAFDGGSAIDSYTAACGGVAVTASASPIVVAPLNSGATYSCSVRAHNAQGDGPPSVAVDVTIPVSIHLLDVVSRRIHGNGVGAMDLSLAEAPIGGAITIEPRAPFIEHRIVFIFDAPVTSVANVEVRNINGSFATSDTYDIGGNELIVRSAGYADGARYHVKVFGVNGQLDAERSIGFLLGDVNGDRVVNATDLFAIKTRAGQLVDQSNFLLDLNATGVITAADVSATKARSGNTLP